MKLFLAILALCVFVLEANGKAEQIKMAFSGKTSGDRTISWFTPSKSDLSIVEYWPSSSTNSKTNVTADQVSYGFGWHYHASLSDLSPSTRYSYHVMGDDGAFSETFSFTTEVKSNFTVAIFGDWGYLSSKERPFAVPVPGRKWTAEYSRACLDRLVAKDAIQWVYHLGDLSYADDAFIHHDDVLKFDYENIFNNWSNWVQNVTAVMPYMTVPGNHESGCHSPACVTHFEKYGEKLSNFTAYNARFKMPSSFSDGALNMWYSFDYSNVHFVGMNTETDYPGAAEEKRGDAHIFKAGSFGRDGQYIKWLEADLAKAAADPKVDWIIAGGHRPLGFAGTDKVLELFSKYGVSIYFCGHIHSYSRFAASQHQGIVQIIVGGAGNDEQPYPKDGRVTCSEWCTSVDSVHKAKLSVKKKLGINVPSFFDSDDHCAICGSPNDAASGPVYFTDKYAIGVLNVDGKKLNWNLLSSKDDTILDTLTLSKK